MKKKFLFLTFFLFLMCRKEGDPCAGKLNEYDAFLYGNFENQSGGIPKLTVDLSKSSQEINIDNTPSITEQSGRILFNYSGVTFKEGNIVYKIDDVITEKKNSDGCWLLDDENMLNWTYSKSLDIVLVLDVSSSIGSNIGEVKTYAQAMVSKILAQNPDARIAIIKFSRGSVSYNFSSSASDLNQFISQNSSYSSTDIGTYNLEGRSETALYESISEAVDLLSNSNSNGQGIITFTDGVSNYQLDPQNQSSAPLISKLNNTSISSYTIGFVGNQGSVDKNVLQQIAINGDFSFPKNLNELDTVFQKFSNSVAAVYDLVYDTNNAKLSNPIEHRFLFKTTQISP